ncbi:ATP-dependent zinc metalloprotease FtsH [Clostridium acetireducens DSM 10703]|jgi:cell division protease FtsH|uniref:ATP-dependent zinc metalloprotease FtsH n=1 Tax=Clostridium acetireducens DSM 10703 TaxID=1121290 RepID=A0A1E8EY75_9CLOT|nr:ATP-dependent metallopeptidase FtsH/Yme1/Tma family protein [Clostridium acetireducens]OFI05883.1 ATP-dependent zinc metalloprotease FtsH [Clostridium acetireducens DSM 10703]
MNKIKNKYLFIPLITAILSLFFLIVSSTLLAKDNFRNYTNFLKDLNEKKISKVYITQSPKINVKLQDGTMYETDNPRTSNFKEELLKKNVTVLEKSPTNLKISLSISSLIISLAVLITMLIKSSKIASKGIRSVDSLEIASVENNNLNFENVAGNEEAKESVKDIVDFLKNPEKYTSYGARMPKGIILYGEPGTGKTLIAKAVAGEAGVPFYALSGSDFIQVYVGVGASRIRQLFKKARNNGKAVIFIDEIDAIGKKRQGSNSGGSEERDQTLNALLTEMSGFNEKEGIVVIAATNRLDILDPALLRPGRFDRHIEISLPDISAREKILCLHLKNKPVKDIDIKEWAKKTAYFSGAKIESLVNESAILACKESSEFIENYHLDKAFSIVIAGYEKKNRDFIKEKDKKITAFHEAGHALVSLKLLPKEKVSKITIIPSTKGAGGYTLSIPEDSLYQNKDYLKKRIMVMLGGRAAEEIIFGKDYITTGAYSDLKQSSNIAFNMVSRYGMGDTLGLLNMEELQSLNMNQDNIIKECKNLIDTLYKETKSLILKEKNILEKLTTELLSKETLYYEDIKGIKNIKSKSETNEKTA